MLEAQKLEGLGVLAGGIAHDFNNILTSILGHASLGLMKVAPGAPEADHFQRIADASQRAADLCSQLLAYSGKSRFVIQRLDAERARAGHDADAAALDQQERGPRDSTCPRACRP